MIRIVEEDDLAFLREELSQGGYVGPVYGFPKVGSVDFTAKGAAKWRHFQEKQGAGQKSDAFPYCDLISEAKSRYFCRYEAAVAWIQSELTNGGAKFEPPVQIGPWQAQWWRRYPSGWRVDFTEELQHQGRCPSKREMIHLDCSLTPKDIENLRTALITCGVSELQWALLAQADQEWPANEKSFCRLAIRRFAMLTKKNPSRLSIRQGLQECFERNWLQVLDESGAELIREEVRRSGAHLATPSIAMLHSENICYVATPFGECVPRQLPLFNAVDFTQRGASLYRLVSAQWLGEDWDDGLVVERCWRSKVRYYCETESGLSGIEANLEAQGRVIRSRQLILLGRWSVFWHERFESGYCLELEFGDSAGQNF